MPVNTPNLVWLMAQEFLDCVCEALAAESECGCPCRSYVAFGSPAWDECCDGQLTSYVERLYVVNNFPAADSDTIQCTAPLAADFVIQLIRCVPVLDDNGVAPSADALSQSAQQIMTEWYISERALICCLAAYKKRRNFSIRDSRPIGPQGGCAGFEIRFTVELIDPIPVV